MNWREFLLLCMALLVLTGAVAGAWLLLRGAFRVIAGALALIAKHRPRLPRRHRRGNSRTWDWIVLPEDTKEELQIIQSILRDPRGYKKRWGQEPPRGIILHGPPGTGKTLIARTLARDAGYHFLAVSTADIKAKFIGESERRVRELYRSAREAAPCIVFFDELEGLASQRSSATHDSGGGGRAQNSLTNQILQEIDGFSRVKNTVFTVGATNHLELVDNALLSRLSYQIHIDLPDEQARRQLFRIYTYPYKARLAYPLTALVEASEGMSGRDIETVCNVAAMLAHGRGKEQVGHEEFGRAFARLNRTLSAPSEITGEPCPGCASDNPNCPIYQGTGRIEVAPVA